MKKDKQLKSDRWEINYKALPKTVAKKLEIIKKTVFKFKKPNLSFIHLVLFSSLLIAGTAAFFSIFGLSALFAGAYYSVIFMAGSLELGKLVTASLLYRKWGSFNILFRSYYMVATIVLIFITSMGIYGYLSSAYQKASLDLKQYSQKREFVQQQITTLKEDKVYLKKELEQTVASYPENYITAKRKVRQEFNPQINKVSQSINQLSETLFDIDSKLINTNIDVGPIIFVARTFDLDIDYTVNLLILILICVFDPLAVMLIIAYNKLMMEKNEQENTEGDVFVEEH